MAKKNLNSILNVPEFLGVKRQSSETYELDLSKLTAETELSPELKKVRDKKAEKIICRCINNPEMTNKELKKLEDEYASKGDIVVGYALKFLPDLKLKFLKEAQPRYVLFSAKDKDKDADKKIVRFSESGGNSHLGIVGGLVGELDRYLGLSVKDVKLHQSHHNEQPLIIDDESLEVRVDGGGFIYFEPKKKEILLSGKSKTFDLYDGDYAVKHQLQVHNSAKGVIENWLQERGNKDYKVKII